MLSRISTTVFNGPIVYAKPTVMPERWPINDALGVKISKENEI